MTKKSESRKERNRLKKHSAIERNRVEIKRATAAREAWLAEQTVRHFEMMKEQDPSFAAMCEEMGVKNVKSVTLDTNVSAGSSHALEIETVIGEMAERVSAATGIPVGELKREIPSDMTDRPDDLNWMF
jgi:hypothetical protein